MRHGLDSTIIKYYYLMVRSCAV